MKNQKFRTNLAVERARARLTQNELAEKVGVSRNCIQRIETGKTVDPNLIVSMKIARELNCNVEDIFEI